MVVVDNVNLTAFTPTGFLNAAGAILGGESASSVLTGAAITGVNQLGTALINAIIGLPGNQAWQDV
jgi:hypothetical protein